MPHILGVNVASNCRHTGLSFTDQYTDLTSAVANVALANMMSTLANVHVTITLAKVILTFTLSEP